MEHSNENKPIGKRAAILLTALGLIALSTSAQAGLISGLVDANNDCPGFFELGNGFSTCEIDGSPSIAKFEGNGESGFVFDESNTMFPTIDGSEWSFQPFTDPDSAFWTYVPNDDADPDIRFFSVKASNQFNLYYSVPVPNEAGCSGANILDANCLALAEVLPVETQFEGFSGNTRTVSHITFYDTGGPDITVPTPGTLALMILGGVSFVVGRRRRS